MAAQDGNGAGSEFRTVTELARELGVTARAIRLYEDKGLISPARVGTTRVYAARDKARMIIVLRGKRLGFSLREIREYLDLYDAERTQEPQIRMLLGAVRKRLGSLLEQRAALDDAIGELEEIERQAADALGAMTVDVLSAA